MRIIDADLLKEKLCILGEHRIERLVDKEPTVCDIDAIRDEINGIEIHGQVDEHTSFIRTGEQVKQMALEIISKFTKGE